MDPSLNDKKAPDILRQMESYQFDMPVKVSVILEDDNTSNEIPHQTAFNLGIKDTINNNMEKIISTSISGVDERYSNSNEMIINQSYQPDTLFRKKSQLLTQLDTLSLDLLRVIEFKEDTMNNYNYDTNMHKKARDNYLRFKNNIFNKSYATATFIIEARRRNNSFLNKFINRTLAIAHKQSESVITGNIIEIILELIQWTLLRNAQNSKDGKYNKFTKNDQVNVAVNGNISPQLKEKKSNMIPPTFKKRIFGTNFYDKTTIDAEEIIPSKNEKAANPFSCSENNPIGFNNNENWNTLGSKNTDNLGTSPLNHLIAISGGNEICTPSRINSSCHEMMFTAQDELQLTNCVTNEHIKSNTSNTLVGQCSFCKVYTRSMCLGCQNVYYCSYRCQLSEWESHKHLCRR